MTDKQEPAFPCAAYSVSDDLTYQPGLTKREYFAAHALQGLLANSHTRVDVWSVEYHAEWAFKVADAMIKAGEDE